MAILTSDELCAIRRHLQTGNAVAINYTKAQVNAATQAIEDWFEANRASLAAAINAATDPFVFTNAQKLQLVKHWLRQKFERGG